MKNAAFMVPRIRGLDTLLRAHPEAAMGSVNEHFWPAGANGTTLTMLLRRWSGMLRGLTLAGYRSVELFVQAAPATSTDGLVAELATFGFANMTLSPDLLDDARSTAPALLVGLVLEPMWAFGERGGAPLALELATDELQVEDLYRGFPPRDVTGNTAPTSTTSRGWLGFTSDTADFREAIDDFVAQGLAVAAWLATQVEATWYSNPNPLGPPCGLGWIFDHRNWWFPPRVPAWPDNDGRILRDALTTVATALATGEIDVGSFLVDQIVRERDPFLLLPGGSFGALQREYGDQPPSIAVEAYARRVDGLASANLDTADYVAEHLAGHFLWTDAVLAMVEHGAIGAAHHLVPELPSTALSDWGVGVAVPEWTTPLMTGQWDAIASTDTLVCNQAGSDIAGMWQRRVSNRLDRHIFAGSLVGGDREGGPLTFTVKVWEQPELDWFFHDESSLGPPIDANATIYVEQPAVGLPTITLDVAGVGTASPQTLAMSPLGRAAHHTAHSMRGLSPLAKDRIRALRDAPLHYAEIVHVETLIDLALHYVERFLTEEPGFIELAVIMQLFETDVRDRLGSFVDNDALMDTVRFYVQSTLAEVRGEGGDTALTVLKAMFIVTFRITVDLQNIYGLPVLAEPDGAYFRYRWRIRDIKMIGAAYFASVANGTGTFELQRVDAHGATIGPLHTRKIDLTTLEAGAVFGPVFGPDDIADWQFFDPTYRDIEAFLDGAAFSLTSASASWTILDSSSSIDVAIYPTDDLPAVTGRIEADLIKLTSLPDLDPTADDLDPDEIYSRVNKAKGLIDNAKDLKKGKKVKPEAKISTTNGWLQRADDTSTRPVDVPIEADEYVIDDGAWARFGTRNYDITVDFRLRIRQCLLWNLALLTRIGEVTIEGHASRLGDADYNERLSRDRAMSVLTAIYDTLGPQLTTPWGDLRVVGKGESGATGDPDDDLEYDRRVDVIIAGGIRLRS